MMKRVFHRAVIALALLLIPTVAQAEWWEAKSAHFIVYSESRQADSEAFALLLERYDGALRTLQNKVVGQDVGDANKVMVFRYGNTADIGSLAGSETIAGFYIPRAGQPVAFVPIREYFNPGARAVDRNSQRRLDGKSVLFHEYTHHFMLQTFPGAYPSWYVEGYAETLATTAFFDDGSFFVGNPPLWRASALFDLPPLPAGRMLDSKYVFADMSESIQRYSYGWLLTHYLSFSNTRQGQLGQYLKALAAGEESITAARRIFGDLGKLDEELHKYKSSRMPGITVKPANYVVPKVTMRLLGAEEAQIMPEFIRQSRGVSRVQAERMAEKLNADAAAFPKSYFVQRVASEANLDARNYGEAILSADRALALKPNSAEVMILKARALFEDKKADPKRFTEARLLLGQARQIDSRDPRALIEIYNSYRKTGQPIPESALIAIEDAYDLASHDGTYRLILTRQLLDEGKVAAARQVIGPLAFSYDGSDPKKNLPGKIVEQLDAKDIDGARATIKSIFDKFEKAADK